MSNPPGDDLQKRLAQANSFKIEGRYEEAIAEYRGILVDFPDLVVAHIGLGLTLCFQGEFDESIGALQRAVELQPDCMEAHLCLAKTLAMLGLYAEAKGEFLQVLRLSPGNKEAMRQLSYFDSAGVGDSS